MKLIDKDALVAEIERIYNEGYKFLPSDIAENIQNFKDDVLININTLEVKEVDFDTEWKRYFENRGEMATVNIKHLAKYFFELGLQVAQKGEKV